MAFSLTSKQIELRGSWLVAYVQKPDAQWTFSKLNLNDHIGNKDGQFDVTMSGWSNSAKSDSCRLEGTLLVAQLRHMNGSFGQEITINLDLFVRNNSGALAFQKLHDSIILSSCCLKIEQTSLSGLSLAADGKLHYSTVDLNEYYGNIRGEFKSGEKHYAWTGRNFRLEDSSKSVKLIGELKDGSHVYRAAEVDISICVVNQNGRLTFIKQTVKKEQAARALATCTNSTIVCAGILVGMAVGTALGNPLIGGVIGAGLASPIGILAETKIADALIDDPRVRSDIHEATVGRYIYETLRNMLAAGAAAFLAEGVSAAAGPVIDTFIEGVVNGLATKGLKLVIDFSVYSALKK
ncbi:MAG: hypothetical protein Q9163_003538 [Psora crenata]